jgi:SET domain-containing protein
MPRKITTRRSAIHGNGMFAVAPIDKGERLIQYKGKLRTHAQVDNAYGGDDENGHTFLFTLNDKYVIDANVGGNVARWINHSCEPNCEAVYDEADSGKPKEDRILIEALRDIRPGEELTYNYGIVL